MEHIRGSAADTSVAWKREKPVAECRCTQRCLTGSLWPGRIRMLGGAFWGEPGTRSACEPLLGSRGRIASGASEECDNRAGEIMAGWQGRDMGIASRMKC